MAPKILITGGTGYLGSKILGICVRQGYQVAVLKRRQSNTFRIAGYLPRIKSFNTEDVSLESTIICEKYDVILHCATEYGRRDTPVADVISANLLLPLRLLELSVRAGTKVFINTDTMLDRRISHYSLSKKQFKDWLLAIPGEQARVNIAIEHFYGPGDDATKFLSYIVNALLEPVDRIPLTVGWQKRDFVHVDDVANAIGLVLRLAGSSCCDLRSDSSTLDFKENSASTQHLLQPRKQIERHIISYCFEQFKRLLTK